MRSMTGFGRAQMSYEKIELEIEIKAVNSRFFEVKTILPRELSFFEEEIRRTVSSLLNRGMIEVKLFFNDRREANISINESKLIAYYNLFRKAANILEIKDDIKLEVLINEPGVIQSQNSYLNDELLTHVLIMTLKQALSSLIEAQENEGKQIKKNLAESINRITKEIKSIKQSVMSYKIMLFNDMKQKTIEILGERWNDSMEQRIIQELAIFIDKYDIQEEISRIENHISIFKEKLSSKVDIGKGLNFILQEMQREANTLGAKYSTVKSFSSILTIKEEIEKCREIVQNVM